MFTVSDEVREITVTEAGALAGVSAEIIRRACRENKIKVSRVVGRSILIDVREVQRWIEERKAGRA